MPVCTAYQQLGGFQVRVGPCGTVALRCHLAYASTRVVMIFHAFFSALFGVMMCCVVLGRQYAPLLLAGPGYTRFHATCRRAMPLALSFYVERYSRSASLVVRTA